MLVATRQAAVGRKDADCGATGPFVPLVLNPQSSVLSPQSLANAVLTLSGPLCYENPVFGSQAGWGDQANYLLLREKRYTLAVFTVGKECLDVQRPEKTTEENAEAQAQEAPQTTEIPQTTKLSRTPLSMRRSP